MTVLELLKALEDVPGDFVVTCSPGGGVLSAVTPTVNGGVILDAEPSRAVAARLLAYRGDSRG